MTYEEALHRIRYDTIMRTGRYPDKTHELQMHHRTWAAIVHETMALKKFPNFNDLSTGRIQFFGFPVVLNPKMQEGDLALTPKMERL